MQARFFSLVAAAAILAAATTAMAQSIQAQPAEQAGGFDAFLEIDGVKGESNENKSPPPPPPPPPPQNAPMAEQGVQSQNGGPQGIGMLLPAVQKVRELPPPPPPPQNAPIGTDGGVWRTADESAAAAAGNGGVWRSQDGGRPAAGGPQNDGVVVLTDSLPSGEAAGRGTGTLTLSNGGQAAANDPEQPVCGHCGADAQVQTQAQTQQTSEAQEDERPRRRGGFSLSIGGVSIGSGGVRVAVGDVTGDGGSDTIPQGAGEAGREVTRAPAPARTSSRR